MRWHHRPTRPILLVTWRWTTVARIFSSFENSWKIEEKLYNYYFFTTVIKTKMTFLTTKKHFWGWRQFKSVISDQNIISSFSKILTIFSYLWKSSMISGNFCVQLDISHIHCTHSWDIKLNTQREIPYLTIPIYYFLFLLDKIIRPL